MKNIRLFIVAFSVVIASCNSGDGIKTEPLSEGNDPLIDSTDLLTGIYEYEYPYNTENLNENHSIVLREYESYIKGTYYGTSDEFDLNRAGYYPGYFVTDMKNLIVRNDSIFFTLDVPNSQILVNRVDLKIKSFKGAINTGNINWPNKIPTNPKKCRGLINKDRSITLIEDRENDNKNFEKK